MKIFFVRHGETDWNKDRRIQGQVNIGLNDFGRTLAEKTAVGLSNIPFKVCYSSPLERAKETAEIILQGRKVPIYEEPRIIEMAFGEYEGKCCAKDGWNVPPDFKRFFDNPPQYSTPVGGEHFTDVIKRTREFLTELYQKKELETETILVTTHGAALAGILNTIKKQPLSQFWGGGVHKNCAVTEVEVNGQIPVIVSENVVYYDDYVAPWEE